MNIRGTEAPDEVIHTRFLVIGSGAGGLWSALHLADAGQTAVITKGAVTESNTNYAQGGIAVAVCSFDTPSLHANDTLLAGAGLCDEPAVDVLTREGPERVIELMQLGAEFERAGDELLCRREAAHSMRRIIYAHGDATGAEVQRALTEHTTSHPNITVREHVQAIRLLRLGDAVVGADAIETTTGRRLRFVADATVLAGGGFAAIYRYTTSPLVTTGDVQALALRAGATLQDMEFVQFHPTALATEESPAPLISEAVRGEGAVLLNPAGERFMPAYHPLAELAPRDVVARAMFAEMQKFGADHCLLDLSPIPRDKLEHHFPHILQTLREHGINAPDDPAPVRPAAHYCMGGIATDLWGFTGLRRLYAVGECACTGVHGANRLASNSLLEALVFGYRLSKAARDEALLDRDERRSAAEAAPEPVAHAPVSVHARIREMMWEKVGIVRDPQGLLAAEAAFRQMLDASLSHARPWPAPGEAVAANVVLVAWVVASAASTRDESRGAHFRTDTTQPKPQWRCHLLVRLVAPQSLEFSLKPVQVHSPALYE